MKYSLPVTPCAAGVTPVNAVTHAAIVVEGSVDRKLSSRYACASLSPPSNAWRFGNSPPRSISYRRSRDIPSSAITSTGEVSGALGLIAAERSRSGFTSPEVASSTPFFGHAVRSNRTTSHARIPAAYGSREDFVVVSRESHSRGLEGSRDVD